VISYAQNVEMRASHPPGGDCRVSVRLPVDARARSRSQGFTSLLLVQV